LTWDWAGQDKRGLKILRKMQLGGLGNGLRGSCLGWRSLGVNATPTGQKITTNDLPLMDVMR